jgi:hypothetical protein
MNSVSTATEQNKIKDEEQVRVIPDHGLDGKNTTRELLKGLAHPLYIP